MTGDRPKLAAYGRRIAAKATYEKGRAFVNAAMLIRPRAGYEHVFLHLLCQGVEALLKGLLLAIDHSRFNSNLTQLEDLAPLAQEAAAAAGLKSPRPTLLAELERLSDLYSAHIPRYGTTYDLVVKPSSVQSDRVLRRIVALMRFVDRGASKCGACLKSV